MSYLIKEATIINEGRSYVGSVFVVNDTIEGIYPQGADLPPADEAIHAKDKWLIPGAIDDQVHFREPGALHKGSIATESAAAIAGGVTSYMDMPNNQPPCCSLELLKAKYTQAAADSYANYAFYLGADNANIEEIKKINPRTTPGVKVFMGSSTGNMLVDKTDVLERIFAESPVLIATHCEEEAVIRQNLAAAIAKYGEQVPSSEHPVIRDHRACLISSQKAITLALKYNSRLHILHLTTAQEIALLAATQTLLREQPRPEGSTATVPKITGEICVHHLFFTDADYAQYGNLIKCNPAIKSHQDREALRNAVRSGIVKVVATDHAPHTAQEKAHPYLQAPSGLPLIQYTLPLMFQMAKEGIFTPEQVVASMCHGPAENFRIEKRGFIREGYYADLVLIDPNIPADMAHSKLLYKCGWNPLEKTPISVSISYTFVNGSLAYNSATGLTGVKNARALSFNNLNT